MKILITGGHFSPAYSILREIQDGNDVMVVGRRFAFEGDMNETFEYRLCKKENIPFEILETGRLQRKLTPHTIPSLLRFPKGVLEAIKILKRFKPDVVVTFGGYVGLPIALAASMMRIPIVLHEQTQKVGVSSSIIARIASVVCISFESSRKFIRNKNIVLTGNPIRDEFFTKQLINNPPHKPFLYITGGSTGSHAINEAIHEILSELLDSFTVVHQTGNSKVFDDYKKSTNIKNSLPKNVSEKYIISDFFTAKEVAYFFQNAELVISRSGVNTMLELMASKSVSLLIPLPYGQVDEQKDNAIFFQSSGLGDMLEQKDMTPSSLLTTIHAMIEKREVYVKNAVAFEKNIHPDASQKLVEQIYIYGRRKSKSTPKEKKSISL